MRVLLLAITDLFLIFLTRRHRRKYIDIGLKPNHMRRIEKGINVT